MTMKEIAWWILALIGSATLANFVALYATILARI